MERLSFLSDMLINQYGKETYEKIFKAYNNQRKTTFRINTLKSIEDDVLKELDGINLKYSKIDIPYAYILEDDLKKLEESEIYKNGLVYVQSLSSMIPPYMMDLMESNDILDMAASPGGKTCLIGMLTNNKCNITAVEINKIRYERLNYNLKKQGVKAQTMNIDAMKLDDFFMFDTILLDAPCSGSGTLDFNNIKSINSFSKELVDNSSKLQVKMLKKAVKMLKKGHTMIYSTCSILEQENELILKQVLNENLVIEKIKLEAPFLELLKTSIDGTICVMPNEYYEGFFIAKIKKIR